eukprot:gene19344-13990_t
MSELEEVKRDIQEAKADLREAKAAKNQELILKYAGILELLLKKEERLTTG